MDGKTERAIRDQRLSVILDSLAEAVTIRGRNNHLIYANQVRSTAWASSRRRRCAKPIRAS